MRHRSLALSGSCARGEQRPDSNIDSLITFDDPPDLLASVEIEKELRDHLGHWIDLVMESALKPWIGDRVGQEVEPI